MTTIFRKTAQGLEEIETRARRLSPRIRSALILIDGKRTDEELGQLVPQADEILKTLLQAGLIEELAVLQARAPSAGDVPAAAAEPRSDDATDFRSVRRDAVRAINELLGPSGESLALKLERADNAEEMRGVLERAVAYIGNARGGGAAATFANRFLTSHPLA